MFDIVSSSAKGSDVKSPHKTDIAYDRNFKWKIRQFRQLCSVRD